MVWTLVVVKMLGVLVIRLLIVWGGAYKKMSVLMVFGLFESVG